MLTTTFFVRQYDDGVDPQTRAQNMAEGIQETGEPLFLASVVEVNTHCTWH